MNGGMVEGRWMRSHVAAAVATALLSVPLLAPSGLAVLHPRSARVLHMSCPPALSLASLHMV